MSDIQAVPAEDQPAQETPIADVTVTDAPEESGNTPASVASGIDPSTTASASTASDSAVPAAPVPTDPTPAAPAVVSTPPAPAVNDTDMATAAASLEMLANLFSGMDFAQKALRQIGSMGTAISQRQVQLDALDQQLAQAQLELSAVQGDVGRQTDAANSIVSNAVAHATKLRNDADAYVADVRAQALKDAAVVRSGAVAECDAMRAAADQHVSNAHETVSAAQADVGSINALKAVLTGELEDLKTKVAVGRASLRQLLGEA